MQRYYPQNYWFDVEGGTAAELEGIYRKVVLRDHVGFVLSALKGVPGPVLDVGCGGALLPRLLREQGHRILGLDFSEQAALVATKSNGVPVVVGDLSRAPLARHSLGMITMFHVLEHLYDPASYLSSAHDLLRGDGRLIIQVPNAASWQFLLLGERWNGLDVPRHLVNFRTSDLDALLQHCGFEVLRHKHFSLRDNPAGLATSLAPDLDPMARRVRKTSETKRIRLLKDLAYFGLVLASLPFTLLEAACRAGSTVMVEARKKA
ncbi:MAG: class I SAM-dependent methyltransferase [Bryobacteraceae bacterium]